MFPNSSPCSQDTQTESSNFRPLEGTEGPYVQGRFAIDVCRKELLYAASSSCELTMEPVPQLRQALAVIENVCKTSSTVWVNRLQCKQMADSFRAVGEALKGSRWDRNLVCSEPSDGGSNRKYPALDELLTVLRKGESLVSYYKTWKGIGSVVGRIDHREAMFQKVHEELDIIKAQFHFEGFTDVGHEQDFDSITSGLSRTLVKERAEMDESWDRLVALLRKIEQTTGMDMDMMQLVIPRQVAEGMYEVKSANSDVIWEGANSGKVYKATWIGLPCAAKTFATYSPTWVLQQEWDYFNKLSRHPFLEGLSVSCYEQGSSVMDCMNLKELIESQWWRSPVSKECVTVPLNFYCEVLDILLQTGMGMAYLHSKGVVRRDLKTLNILVNMKHPGPNRVDVKREDFGSSKGSGVYEDAGIGSGLYRPPEIFVTADFPKRADVYSFGIICSEILTGGVPFIHTLPFVGLDGLGGMGKTALHKILYSAEQRTFLKHLCEKDWKEYGDVKSCLQKERLMNKVILDLVGDLGTESNLEAFVVSDFKNVGSASEEIATKVMSFASPEGLVHVDGAHEHRRRTDGDIVNVDTEQIEEPAAAQAMNDEAQPSDAISPENVVGSCAPGATSNSPSLVHQHPTEILSGLQMPETLNAGEPARKRNRTRIWSDDEKRALLELTEEAPRVDVGPDTWDYVSDNLWEEHGFDRASNSCQQQWGALLQSYRAIQDHETKVHSGVSGCVSYWDMNEDERSNTKLHRSFDLEWCEMMERILAAKPSEEETRIFQVDADLPSSALLPCQFQPSAIYMDHFGSATCEEALDDESTDEESEEIDEQSEDEELSGDSTATPEAHAEVTADSHEPCYESNSEYHVNEQSSTKSFCETNSKYAGRKRSGEDDLISRVAPFVNERLEEAFRPLIAGLRRREEDEQKHRELMLAIEEEKLALKREKMLFRRSSALANSNTLPESLARKSSEAGLGKGFVSVKPSQGFEDFESSSIEK